jgi:hypothetical protein
MTEDGAWEDYNCNIKYQLEVVNGIQKFGKDGNQSQ